MLFRSFASILVLVASGFGPNEEVILLTHRPKDKQHEDKKAMKATADDVVDEMKATSDDVVDEMEATSGDGVDEAEETSMPGGLDESFCHVYRDLVRVCSREQKSKQLEEQCSVFGSFVNDHLRFCEQ